MQGKTAQKFLSCFGLICTMKLAAGRPYPPAQSCSQNLKPIP